MYYGIVQVVNYLSNLALQSAEKSRMCRSIVGDVLSNERVQKKKVLQPSMATGLMFPIFFRLTSRGRFL